MEPPVRKRSLLSQLDIPTASVPEPRQKSFIKRPSNAADQVFKPVTLSLGTRASTSALLQDSQNACQERHHRLQCALHESVESSMQTPDEQQDSCRDSTEQNPDQVLRAEVAEPGTPVQEASAAPLAALELQDAEAVAVAAGSSPEEDGSSAKSATVNKDWSADQVLQGRAGRRSGTHAARMGTKEMAMRLVHVREGKLPSLADVPEAYLDTIGSDALEPLAAPSTWGQWRGARNLSEQLESGCLGMDASKTGFGASFLAENSDSGGVGKQGDKAGMKGEVSVAAGGGEVAHPACQRVLDNWGRARRNMAACIIQAYFRGYLAKKRVARSLAVSRRSSMHGDTSDWLLREDSSSDVLGVDGSKGSMVDDGTSGAITDFASGEGSGSDEYGASSGGGGSMGGDRSASDSAGGDGSKLVGGDANGGVGDQAALAAQQAAAAQAALQLEMRNLKRKLCQNARDVLLAAQAQQAYSRTRQRLQYLSQSSRFVRIRRASSAAGPAIYEDAEDAAEEPYEGTAEGTQAESQSIIRAGDSLTVTLPSLSEELLQQAARLKVDVLPTLLEGGMEPRHARTVLQYSGLLSDQMETDLLAKHKSMKRRQHVQRQLVMSVKPEAVSKTAPWEETDTMNGSGTVCDTPPRQVTRQGQQMGVRRARFSVVNEGSSEYPSPARSGRDSISSSGGGLWPASSSSGRLPSSNGELWPTSNSGKLPVTHPMSAFQMNLPRPSTSEKLRFSEGMEPAPAPYQSNPSVPHQPVPPAVRAPSRSGRLQLRSRASEPCVGAAMVGSVTTECEKDDKCEGASLGEKSEREAQAVEVLMQLSSLSEVVPSEPKSTETKAVPPVPPPRLPFTGTLAGAISVPSLAVPKGTPRASEPVASMPSGNQAVPAASMPLFPVSRRSSLTCLVPSTRTTARQSDCASDFTHMPTAFAATFKPGGGPLAACTSEPGEAVSEGDLRLISKQSGLLPTSALSRSSSKALSGTLSRSTTLLPSSSSPLVPSKSMVAATPGLGPRPSIPASVSSNPLGMRPSLRVPQPQGAATSQAYMTDMLTQPSTEPWAAGVAESATYFNLQPDTAQAMTGLPSSRSCSFTSQAATGMFAIPSSRSGSFTNQYAPGIGGPPSSRGGSFTSSQVPSRSVGMLPNSSSRIARQSTSTECLDKAIAAGGRIVGGSGTLAGVLSKGSTPAVPQPFLPSSNSYLYSTSGTISSTNIPSGHVATTGTVLLSKPSLKQDKPYTGESGTGGSFVVPVSKESTAAGMSKVPKRIGDGPLGGDMPTLVRAGAGRRLSWTNPTLLAPKQG